MTGRAAMPVALAASLLLHVLAIGLGELFVGGGGRTPEPPRPAVEYRTETLPPSVEEPPEGRPEETGKFISLDTPNPVYRPYFSALSRVIESAWGEPVVGKNDPSQGKVQLEFTISADGELLAVSVARSSGVRGMDLAAVRAVKEASPFEEIPSEIATRELTVRALFVYD